MIAKLSVLFGEVPANSNNLDLVGPLSNRIEEKQEATVWPSSGLVKCENGTLETETIWVQENLAQCKDYYSLWSYFPIYKQGKYFNLSLFWSFSYYHWICDVLPRIHRILPKMKSDVRFILPTDMNLWKKRSLELLGIKTDQCVQYFGRRPWKVESLLYASPVAMTGDHEESSLKWVRDTILNRVIGPGMRPKASKKIYLARKNTWSRNIINEEELHPILSDRGFEVIDCSKISFDEQVRIFSEAACVIGPHGAALTNILWAPQGLKVFEIFEPSVIRRCYWSMCKTLGHYHICGVANSVQNGKRESNIYLKPYDLEHSLDKIQAF